MRSILRETMVLEAIAAEKDIAFMLERIHIESALIVQMNAEGAKSTLRHMLDQLQRLCDRAEFRVSDYIPQAHGSIDALTKLYHALERANIIKNPEPEPVAKES